MIFLTGAEQAGRGCSVTQDCCEEEESQAVRLAQVLSPGRKHSNVKQGEEPAEFWAALGGEVEVKNLDTLSRPARSPRLFHIDEKRWKGYRAFEIFDFEKSVSLLLKSFFV